MDPTWLTSSPPEVISGDGLLLQRPQGSHIEALTSAVQSSITELHQFMPWAVLDYGTAEAESFVAHATAAWEDRSDFPFVILDAAQPAVVIGSAGLINRLAPGKLEIGYWVATPRNGRKIARRATALLIGAARGLSDVRAVEIHHDEGNLASATVPTSLGFTQVDIRDVPVNAAGTTGRMVVWSLTL